MQAPNRADLAGLSIDELIAASAEFDERAHGVFDRLARITARAAGGGIGVTVNVDGMITAVELSEEALRLPADRLAAEIFARTHEAAAAALAEGIRILEPVAGPELLELIAAEEPAPAPAPEDDCTEVESWALPRLG